MNKIYVILKWNDNCERNDIVSVWGSGAILGCNICKIVDMIGAEIFDGMFTIAEWTDGKQECVTFEDVDAFLTSVNQGI